MTVVRLEAKSREMRTNVCDIHVLYLIILGSELLTKVKEERENEREINILVIY
jgi:hypothetical protein